MTKIYICDVDLQSVTSCSRKKKKFYSKKVHYMSFWRIFWFRITFDTGYDMMSSQVINDYLGARATLLKYISFKKIIKQSYWISFQMNKSYVWCNTFMEKWSFYLQPWIFGNELDTLERTRHFSFKIWEDQLPCHFF